MNFGLNLSKTPSQQDNIDLSALFSIEDTTITDPKMSTNTIAKAILWQ